MAYSYKPISNGGTSVINYEPFPEAYDVRHYQLLSGSGEIGDSNLYLYDLVRDILEERTWEDFRDITGGKKAISLSEIKTILAIKGYPNISLEDINYVAQFMISNKYEMKVRRDNFFSHEPSYKYLDPSLHHCSHQWKYSPTIDLEPSSERVIALSADLHIGASNIFSPKLLANFYDYAFVNGAKDWINLGDLFQKISCTSIEEANKEADKRIRKFAREFPKPDIGEMMIWGIPGNGDLGVIEALIRNGYDTRWLSAFNPNFYMRAIEMLPEESEFGDKICPELLTWSPTICGKKFNFNHRVSDGVLDYKITSIEEFLHQLAEWGNIYRLDSWDVEVTAHVHDGFILSTDGKDDEHDKLFLGVPATNLENIGSAVGYLLYIYPEENCMEIAVLGADADLKIREINRVTYSFGKNEKHLRKTFRRANRMKY